MAQLSAQLPRKMRYGRQFWREVSSNSVALRRRLLIGSSKRDTKATDARNSLHEASWSTYSYFFLVTRGLEGALKIQSTSRGLFLTAALCFVASASSVAQTETTYLISGRVHDESNQAVAEIRVCAVPEDYDQVRKAPCGLSDAAGNFVIRTGRPALYRLFPEKSAAGYFVQFSPFFRHPSFPITEVVLNESNRTTSASVSVSLSPKNGTLIGKSLDAGSGRPIDNTWFLLCQSANPKVCWSTSAKNPAGKFHLPAAYVPFTLRAYAKGYEWT